MAKPKLPPIIIVEDSDEDFETVREAVCKMGLAAELQWASTGDECLALLRGVPPRPTIVLMDLNTPGTDGREALVTIRSDPTLKALPVVVFSTSADTRDIDFCYASGANAYHVKPVRYPDHIQVLIDILSYWLGRVVLPEPEGTKP